MIWEQIAAVGLGVWILAAFAALVGAFAARAILVPTNLAQKRSRAGQIGLWRAFIGAGTVAALSLPYRTLEETADKVSSNCLKGSLIALPILAVFTALIWILLRDASREEFWVNSKKVIFRVLEFFAALVALYVALLLLGTDSPAQSPGTARLSLIILSCFVAFLALGCWYISRYWFGAGLAHPLLPPYLPATTLCVVTVLELHFDGPDSLPMQQWLLINLSALITMFGVCFVEVCDAFGVDNPQRPEENAVPAQWPVVTAAALVITALAASAWFVASGTAERVFCTDTPPLVKCQASSGQFTP